jgi:two-component system, NtrC family, response regulator GlrR
MSGTDRDVAEAVALQCFASEVAARFVGVTEAFRRIVAKLPGLARSPETVLITGETGTGKELVARALHHLGPRAAGPFVPVNCASLPESLLESELFGHEAGAFTGARARRRGLIAQAEGGTLLLDEIDALPSRAQAALLRLIQENTFRSLGGTREERVHVRFVAATNAPIRRLVDEGRFRADLYYRLCVLYVHLPALRERRDDIAALAAHFLEKHSPLGGPPRRLTPDACAALLAHDWPGNVRELQNAIIRAVQGTDGEVIGAADLGLPVPATRERDDDRARTGRFNELKRLAIETFEREYLTRLIDEHHGNVTRAARTAGKDRRELGRLLKKYQLPAPRRPATPAAG